MTIGLPVFWCKGWRAVVFALLALVAGFGYGCRTRDVPLDRLADEAGVHVVPAPVKLGTVNNDVVLGIQAVQGGSGATFAVVPGDVSSEVAADTVARLGGRFALLANPETPRGRDPHSIPILTWNELVKPTTRTVVLDYGQGSVVVLVGQAAVSGVPKTKWAATVRQLLQGLVDKRQCVTFVVPASVWQGENDGKWQGVIKFLSEVGSSAVVIVGGEVMAWWNDSGVEILSVPSAVSRSKTGDCGLVWVRPASSDKRFSLIRPAAVSGLARFSRKLLQEKSELGKCVECTPVCGEVAETLVRLRNPLDRKLEVKPEWNFSGADVRVDPQVLSFQLEPGGQYEQKFTFNYAGDQPFKFTQPELLLTMNLSPDSGPFTVRKKLWVCLESGIEVAAVVPVVDGNPSDWVRGTLPVNHATQVVKGVESWGGPAKLSATWSLAHSENHLYIGAQIVDPAKLQTEAVFYVDLNPAGLELSEGDLGLLQIRVTRDGLIDCRGADVALQGAVAESANGYSIELALPFVAFKHGRPQDELRLDMALRERTGPDGKQTVLCYSGNEENELSNRLYGRFKLVSPPNGTDTKQTEEE